MLDTLCYANAGCGIREAERAYTHVHTEKVHLHRGLGAGELVERQAKFDNG